MATAKTIQEQIYREAPEIEAIKLGLLGSAKDLADIPIQLPQEQVAGFTPLQQAAFSAAQGPGGIGGFQPLMQQGSQTLGTGLSTLGTGLSTVGTGLSTVGTAMDPVEQARLAAQGTAGLYQPNDLSAYMNPYQQDVIDATMAELNKQGLMQGNQLGAQAVGAGAYGGSRFGIAEAELAGNLQDARAKALAQLNQQNYLQALQTGGTAFENQQRRQQGQSSLYSGIGQLLGGLGAQQASIGGQQAAIGGQQAGIGGQQLGAAQLAQTAGLRDIETMQKLGLQQQQLDQGTLEAARQNEQRQLMEPYSRVAFLSDIYKGAPSTQQTLGSAVAPAAAAPTTFQQIAGLGTGLLGTAAAANQLKGLF